MNLPYLKSLKFRSLVCFIFLSMVFIIHSCKKEKPSSKTPTVTDSQMISLARQWYDAKYPAVNNGKLTTHSTGTGAQDWTKAFSPYWAKANTFIIDSLTFIELPALKKGDMAMSLRSGIDPKSFNFSKSGSLTSLIIVNKNGTFYLYAMTILADSTYLKGDYDKVKRNTYRNRDADFTGEVFYNRMDGSLVNGWKYTNGLITGAISPAAPGSTPGQVTQSIDKKHTDVFQETDCSTTTTTTYWESCDYYVDDELYEYPFNCSYYTTSSSVTTCTTTTNGGSPSAPPPCTPPTGTPDPTGISVQNTKTIVDVAAPPGGGTGGIVDGTNQIGTAPCPPIIAPPDTTTKIDPCKQIHHVDSIAQKIANAKIISQLIKDTYTGHEYGDEQNLAKWPPNGLYNNTTIRTDQLDNKFTANFTWDSANGYTINISHEHPGGDAPSPGDVFNLLTNSWNKNLQAAGPAALNYYLNNASITTVTTNATYIITITNYSELVKLYDQKSPASWDTEYQETGNNHSGSTEYALLSLFGNAINVFKANANGTVFSVLTFDKNGNLTLTTCP